MSQENVEIVGRAIEVFNRDGPEATTAFFDAEVERHDLPEQPDAAVHHGREGFLEAVEQFSGDFEDFRVVVDEIFAHGDQVVTSHRTAARGGASGATFEQRGAGVWTLRRGLIARVEWFGTKREALEAVGVEE